MSSHIFVTDSLRSQVEAASCGRATVLYDDKGLPTLVHVLPKFSYFDLGVAPQLGNGTVTAFVKDGRELGELFIAQTPAAIHDGVAVAWPGMVPATQVSFDDARAACEAKGKGWHLLTAHEWAAIALWCIANGAEPRGNTGLGLSDANPWEQGRRVDRVRPGDTGPVPAIFNGSGPAPWRHDGTLAGISDLVGNLHEWIDLLKVDDGQVICADDNDWTLDEGSWTAHTAFFDSPAAGDDAGQDNLGAPELAALVNNYAGSQGTTGEFDYNLEQPWDTLATAVGYVSIQLLQRLLIEPAGISFEGELLVRNYGERMVARGGDFDDAAQAGLGAMSIMHARTLAAAGHGFRPVFGG